MIAEIQDAPLHPARQNYLTEEFHNQPGWSSTKAALAHCIHRLDRGDVPDKAGNIGCYASVTKLAACINKSTRTVTRLLAELTAEGSVISLGYVEGGTVRRRVILRYDVRERAFGRRKVTTVINGAVVTRRLKKAELPAPVLRGQPCRTPYATDGARNGSLSELRNNPLVPFGEKKFNSDSKPNPGNEASSRSAEASSGLVEKTMPLPNRITGNLPTRAPQPIPVKHYDKVRSRCQQVHARPEIVELLSHHYPVEKQDDRTISMLGSRLRRGSVNVRNLKLALEIKDRLCDMDKPIKQINDFHHFLRAFEYLVSYALEGTRTSVRSKLVEAQREINYPENFADFNAEAQLSKADYDTVAQWVDEEIRMLRAGTPETQEEGWLQRMTAVTARTFAKQKFNELALVFKEQEKEVNV